MSFLSKNSLVGRKSIRALRFPVSLLSSKGVTGSHRANMTLELPSVEAGLVTDASGHAHIKEGS